MEKAQKAEKISKKRLLNILTFFDEKRIGRFVARNIFKNNKYTRFYWGYILTILFTFIYFQITQPVENYVLRFWILSIVGSFIAVLIPIHIIHEVLRSSLLKNIGEVKVNYLWSWENMILKVRYQQLQHTTKRDLIKVSILPFFIFSISPLIASFFFTEYVRIFLLSLAFFHGIYSIKAFALLSFLRRKKKQKEIDLSIN